MVGTARPCTWLWQGVAGTDRLGTGSVHGDSRGQGAKVPRAPAGQEQILALEWGEQGSTGCEGSGGRTLSLWSWHVAGARGHRGAGMGNGGSRDLSDLCRAGAVFAPGDDASPLSALCVCSAISWSQRSSGQNPEVLERGWKGNAALNKLGSTGKASQDQIEHILREGMSPVGGLQGWRGGSW